jgi:hypothetical protein
MEHRFWFAFKWAGCTLAGWLLGWTLIRMGSFVLPANSIPYTLSVVPMAFILVLSITLLQWRLMLRKIIPIHEAFCMSGVSAASCAAAQYFLNTYLPETMNINMDAGGTFRLLDGWFPVTIFSSILLGVSLSVPQWILLRNYQQQSSWWLFDNVVAVFAALIFLFASGRFDILGLFFTYFFLSPLVFGLITGLTLFGIIARKPKPKHDDARIEYEKTSIQG